MKTAQVTIGDRRCTLAFSMGALERLLRLSDERGLEALQDERFMLAHATQVIWALLTKADRLALDAEDVGDQLTVAQANEIVAVLPGLFSDSVPAESSEAGTEENGEGNAEGPPGAA